MMNETPFPMFGECVSVESLIVSIPQAHMDAASLENSSAIVMTGDCQTDLF